MVRFSTLVRDPERALPGAADAGSAATTETRTVRAVDLVRDAPSASTDAPVAVARPPAVRRAAAPILHDLQAFLADVRTHVRTTGMPSWRTLGSIIDRIVESLAESAELFWLANSPTDPSDTDSLVVHQARVAIMAVRIGLDLGYDPSRAATLGMAGGLIDVGLWEAPDGLHDRLDVLTPAERAIYRSHPERSAALLSRWSAPEALIATVLQHHERDQGQGFPQQLEGTAISQDARIVGLVDAYAMRSAPSTRRPALRPHEAIRELVRSKQDAFAPALVKALLSEISVFPPGTVVRLNTGEVGQVVAVNRNHPLRPRIDVVADARGQRPAVPKTIDLAETPFLYITGPAPASS